MLSLLEKVPVMKIAKVIEVRGQSAKSWKDAEQQALIEAAGTASNIETLFLADYQKFIDEKDIDPYHVKASVYLSYYERD